jgi:hypothetical protein
MCRDYQEWQLQARHSFCMGPRHKVLVRVDVEKKLLCAGATPLGKDKVQQAGTSI